MKITASESVIQTLPPREIFPLRNNHQVESITLGVSLSRKEDGKVCLLFDLKDISRLEKNLIETTISLTNTTTNEIVVVSTSEQQFVNLDPSCNYELKVTKGFSTDQMTVNREIVCVFSSESASSTSHEKEQS